MTSRDKCGHGIPYTEPCLECDIFWDARALEEAEKRIIRLKANLVRLRAEKQKKEILKLPKAAPCA